MNQETLGETVDALNDEPQWQYAAPILAELRKWYRLLRSGRAEATANSSSQDSPKADVNSSDNQRGILLLGAGGVGKSTLLKLLHPDRSSNVEIGAAVYNESKNIEVLEIPGADSPTGLPIGIVAPPGQKHRRGGIWNAMKRSISAGEFRGIILISAFGYHSIDDISLSLLPEFRRHPDDKSAGLDDYLANRRKDELAILKEIAPHLTACREPIWLISLISKEDLWVPSRENVEEFYRIGPYAKAVSDVTTSRLPHNFRHEIVFASLIINNFRTSRGEPLAHNTAGYDAAAQKDSLARLKDTFVAVHAWEHEVKTL